MATPSLASNVIAKTALNLFNVVIPLIVTSYVYHELGPLCIGSVQYAHSLFSYFLILGLFGTYNYGLREISAHRKDSDRVRSLFKNMMVWGVISNLAALSIYVTFIMVFISDPMVKTLSWILATNLFSQALYTEWYLEAMEEFRFITLKTMAIRLASVLMIFIFVHTPEDVYIYMSITVGVAVVNYLVSFAYTQHKLRMGLREMFSGLELRRYFMPLITIMILNNSAALYTVMDSTIIGYFLGKTELAYFSIGDRMCDMMRTLLLSVVFATLPRLSLYLQEDKRLYQEGLLKVMQMLLFIAIPCGVALLMLSPEMVDFFGGREYIPGIPVTRLFSVRIVILCVLGIMYNQIIFLHGHERLLLVLNIGCGVLNIIFNLLCLNFLTPLVSLVCTVAAEVIYILINAWFITRKLRVRLGILRPYTLLYLGVSLLFIPIIYYVQSLELGLVATLSVTVPVCIAVYMLVMRSVGDSAYHQLSEYLRRLAHRGRK